MGINERVVSSLTLPLYENNATLLPLWFKASGGNERARILVLLIVLHLIGQARKGEKILVFLLVLVLAWCRSVRGIHLSTASSVHVC